MSGLSVETKIGIPLTVVGALVCWVLLEVKDLGQKVARIEGRLDAADALSLALPPRPAFPDLPSYPIALATTAITVPHEKGRQP